MIYYYVFFYAIMSSTPNKHIHSYHIYKPSAYANSKKQFHFLIRFTNLNISRIYDKWMQKLYAKNLAAGTPL